MSDANARRKTPAAHWNVAIMVLTGDLDDPVVRRLEHTAQHLPHGARLRLDLSRVTWVGAAGMRLLQRWHNDPSLTLSITDCSPAVRRTAAHANLSAMLPTEALSTTVTLEPAA